MITMQPQRAVLFIHGFTGGPFEIGPLAERLTAAGWLSRVPELPGHGNDSSNLGNVSWREWLRAAEKETLSLAGRYGQLDVVGFSMGGFIAAYLASRYPVRKLVLLSPAVVYFSPGRYAREFVRQFAFQDNRYLLTIKRTPLSAVWQFIRLAKHLRKEFPRIRVPTLIVQGERDEIVHPLGAKWLYRRLVCEKQIRFFPNSRHRILLGAEARQVCDFVERFLLT